MYFQEEVEFGVTGDWDGYVYGDIRTDAFLKRFWKCG